MFGSACQTFDIGMDKKLRERALPIDPDAFRIGAKMAPAGQTVAAMTAHDVTFARDEIARREAFHASADALDHADKFMPDDHRHRESFSATTRPSCKCGRRSRRSTSS